MNAIGVTPLDMPPGRDQEYRDALKAGKFFVVHIAEGKRSDPQAQSEFALLKNAQLLAPKTVIVHGVGLDPSDFAEMANISASLVWSPRSNLVLYGETTDVMTALRQGVTVALAPDWSPTGSTNMLAELKYANGYSMANLAGAISPKQLFEMATSVPARIAGVDQWVGSIAAGKFADVFMMKSNSPDPYASLVSGLPSDVTLVVVNGVPVYGTADGMAQAGVAGTEDVMLCGEKRSINSQALGNGSFSTATAKLSAALTAEHATLGPVAECN